MLKDWSKSLLSSSRAVESGGAERLRVLPPLVDGAGRPTYMLTTTGLH